MNIMPHLEVETIFRMSLDPATKSLRKNSDNFLVTDLLDGVSTPACTSGDRSVSINLNTRYVRAFKHL